MISPLLIPSLGLPPISSSYTLHSFTSPGPSTRSFPSISTFVFPLATSVLFHLSSLVALPLPSRIFHPYPQVHVHVRVRVLILCARGSLIPLPLYLPHQLLDSPSASYPRPLRFVVFHRAPAKRLFSRSSARHSPDIPVAASTSFDHIFCIGNGKENKTPGTCSRRLWMAFSSSRDTHTHTHDTEAEDEAGARPFLQLQHFLPTVSSTICISLTRFPEEIHLISRREKFDSLLLLNLSFPCKRNILVPEKLHEGYLF